MQDVGVILSLAKSTAGTVPFILQKLGKSFSVIHKDEFIRNNGKVDFKSIIVLGSTTSVLRPFDEHMTGFANATETFMRDGGKVLGMCSGSQILAHIAGGNVTPHPDGILEIGYYDVDVTPDADFFVLPSGEYYIWHADVITGLPREAVLMRSFYTDIQAFHLDRKHVGIQFHPEIRRKTLESLTIIVRKSLSMPGAQPREQQIDRHRTRWHANTRAMEKFLAQWAR